jgi:hypothetical protein
MFPNTGEGFFCDVGAACFVKCCLPVPHARGALVIPTAPASNVLPVERPAGDDTSSDEANGTEWGAMASCSFAACAALSIFTLSGWCSTSSSLLNKQSRRALYGAHLCGLAYPIVVLLLLAWGERSLSICRRWRLRPGVTRSRTRASAAAWAAARRRCSAGSWRRPAPRR